MKNDIFYDRIVSSLRDKIQELYEQDAAKDARMSEIIRRAEALQRLISARDEQLEKLRKDNAELRATVQNLDALLKEKGSLVSDLEAEAQARVNQLRTIEMQVSQLQNTLRQVYESKTWRIGQFFGRWAKIMRITPALSFVDRYINTLRRSGKTHLKIMREEGLVQYLRYSWNYRKRWATERVRSLLGGRRESGESGSSQNAVSLNYRNHRELLRQQFSKDLESHKLERILGEQKGKNVVLYPSPVPWNIPLIQRPHHIMRELARRDYLVFFLTPKPFADNVEGIVEIETNLYLVSSLGFLRRLEDRAFYLWITWTPTAVCRELFPGSLVVYDWIDELDVFYLYGDLMEEDHLKLLREADIVLASSQALADKASLVRPETMLVQNGVAMEDFLTGASAIPDDMGPVLLQKKPIVGFYGSLETWRMDYDLVNYLVRECPDLNFVFIGPSYDGSAEKLVKAGNLFLLGPKSYEKLKYYLRCFDVAIIPYVVNRITNSVFPVKLCEYMAAEKPVVTTDMRECRNFKTVLISKDQEDFVSNLRVALKKKNDAAFLKTLMEEAGHNTWKKRVDIVVTAFDRFQSSIDLRHIIRTNRGHTRGIIIYPPTMDWNLPLFQRPHHLALQFAKLGYLTFYCTVNHTYDKIRGINPVGENLYVTDQYDLLTRELSEGWLIISSVSSVSTAEMRNLREKGFRLVYDYLDEIHADISGSLTDYLSERHRMLSPIFIDIVTAISTKLCDEMKKRFPQERVLFLPNGVDYAHFHREQSREECPADLREIIGEGKPIIGYHGALAQWIDYDLINDLADRKPGWNIVLIGWNYDGSMSALRKRKNIKYLGLRLYQELPKSSIWFDVAMIPFKEGDIAKSTSPIKLFEYMAMQKPTVVTKDLIECRGKGVLRGEDHEDFINKVEQALALKNDPDFLRVVDEEARSNTWEDRARKLASEMEKISGRNNVASNMSGNSLPEGSQIRRSRFESLLLKKWGVSDLHEVKDPVHVMWIDWALSTFDRGEHIMALVSQYTDIRGKRYMDVGCGYGGFLVAFSRAGAAEVMGLEINPVYFEYYGAISQDCEIALPVFRTDVLDRVALGSHGKFDIITCNDVIEHVDDPEKALANIAEILEEKGLLFMQIPNRFSASFIESDGHYKLFGITLLPKWMADTYHAYSYPGSRHDVCYRSLQFYLNVMKQCGLNCQLINNVNERTEERLDEILMTLDQCKAKVDILDSRVSQEIRRAITSRVADVHRLFNNGYERYLELKQTDSAAANELAKSLIILFGEDFWQIVARREPRDAISCGKESG